MPLNNSSLRLPANTTSLINLSTSASLRGLENLSFMAWFKVGPNSVNAPAQSAYVERQGTGTGIRFRFTPVAGKLQFGFCPVDGGIDTSYTYNTRWDDRWHHAAFVARIKGQNPTYQIYLDGVKVAEGTLVRGGDTVEKVSDTAPLGVTIGNHSRGSVVASTAWEGSIDEVIILKEATAQNEILDYIQSKDSWALKEGLSDPNQEPLKHYWKFDENSGTTTTDSRDSALTGSLPTTLRWTTDRPFIGNGLDDTTIPSTPGNPVTSQVSHDSFVASWSPSTDNVHVQFYELQVSEYSNFSVYSSYDVETRTSHHVKGLLTTVNYYWRVRALDASRNSSAYSIVRSLTTSSMGDSTPPNPPTNLTALYVTHSSFRLTATASNSGDVKGYKLDISTSALFDTYIEGYRNLDIGNSTVKDVFSVEPLSSYYVRLRAYDMFDNESSESAILRVNTLRQPDITPPQIVTLQEVSGLSARTVTLAWDEGVDDTGVSGYYVEISKSPVFSSFVSTKTHIWQNFDVGNVTEYRVTGLDEETDYYWRVRGYDEAGNVGDNTETPGTFRTAPASIYEAGFINMHQLPTNIRTGSTPETIGEAQPTEFFVGPSSNLYVEYDASTVVGTIQSVMFNFFPKLKAGNTLGNLTLRVYTGEITSGAVGQSITYNVLEQNQLQNVDLTFLFSGGASKYTIEISSAGYQGYIDTGQAVAGYSANPTGIPTLEIESDPNTSTQPLLITHDILTQERVNVQLNPSFEINTNGWRGLGGATIVAVGSATSGIQSCRVVGSTSGSGIDNFQSAPQLPAVTQLSYYTASFDLSRVSGYASFNVILQAVDNLGANPVQIATKNIRVRTSYSRYSITGFVPQNKSRLRLAIVSAEAGAYELNLDNVLVEQGQVSGAIFNGNTFDGIWKGATNNSVSGAQGAYFEVESPFLGDSNQNNSAKAFIRNLRDDDGWIETKAPVTVDRVLNKYTTHFGPSYGGLNLIRNPSFELDTVYWTGGTRVETEFHMGDCSYNVAANANAEYTESIPVEAGKSYIIQGMVKSDYGLVTVSVRTASTSTSGASTEKRTLASTPEFGSPVAWKKFTLKVDVAGDETHITNIRFSSTMEMWLDCVQVTQSEVIPPYRDGSILDGVWEGNPHRSTSGIQFNGDNSYVTMFEYTDPEGFFDAENMSVLETRGLFSVPAPPDNVTTVQNLILSASEDKIFIIAPYKGDDNENNSVRIEFKRADLTRWNEVRPSYYRKLHEVRATIPGLLHGTSYQIRVYFTDPDGLYGAPMGVIEDTITTDYSKQAIEGSISITFGGFALMGGSSDKIAVTSHDAFGFPDRRVEIEELPRQDGAVERQSPWGAKDIRMEGFISGNTRAELDDLRTALVRALAPSTQKLIIDSLSRKGRYYNATCKSLKIEEDGKTNISHLEWFAVFTCADPFAYDLTETTVPTFTAPDLGQLAIQNKGDAVVYPYIELSTTSNYPVVLSLTNTISGDHIRPKTTIVRGDRLIIDNEKKSVLKNGIEIDYSGGFIRLPIGQNTLEYKVSATSGTPTVQSSLRWRHRYL